MEYEAATAAQAEAQAAFADPDHDDKTRVVLRIVIVGTRVESCDKTIMYTRKKYAKRFDRAVRRQPAV